MLKLMGKKIFTILRCNLCLSKCVKTTPKILMNDIFSSSINIGVNLANLFKAEQFHQRGVYLTISVH